jgi:hypothetical protein
MNGWYISTAVTSPFYCPVLPSSGAMSFSEIGSGLVSSSLSPI